MLDLGIDLNVWPWVWLIVAILFFLIELTLLAGSFVLLPFAVSAFVAAIAGFYDASVETQWAIFVFLGAILWILAYRFARKWVTDNDTPLGVGADRLIGQPGIVTTAIDPDDVGRAGRVSVDGEVWGALTRTDEPIAVGTRVRVVEVTGTRVVVELLPIGSHIEEESP